MGRLKEYTELTKLRPTKSISLFGYVHKVAYVFNKDNLGRPQHEYRLSLMDSKTKRPVPFSLFRDTDDDAFRGQLREGILVRVHRAGCRKTDGGMWLYGKAGVAGMNVVGFELTNVLNVVCTTSPSFSFTQLHHERLNELQRHFVQRGNVSDSESDVFAFRNRPIARLVQDPTPSVTYAIELHEEPLTPGHSPMPLVIKLEDDEPEPRENAAAVDIKPMRLALNAMKSQIAEGVAATRSNTQFTEVVNDMQIPSAEASSRTQPPAPKLPRMERSYAAQPGPSFRNRQTLRSAQQRSYFDCICEVIGVLDNGDHVILRVWDGTRPSRSLARCQDAKPITLDSDLEESVNDYAVGIVCWDEHADSANGLEPHDKVSIVNVHAYVNKSGVEAYTMHGGDAYGRGIRLLQSPQLVEQLESQLSATACRPSTQSQGISDDEESFIDEQ
ncbi:Protection of telomeres protein 1 [Aphelenchoides avenae]|nr:Protection of telomeres protein 1 [Aphelenchus avenae]